MRTLKSQEKSWLFLYAQIWDGNGGRPPVSGCGALKKLRLAKQARFLQTAAHAYAPLYLPLAARSNASIPNTEVKHMYADNTWRATAREDRECEHKEAGEILTLLFNIKSRKQIASGFS